MTEEEHPTTFAERMRAKTAQLVARSEHTDVNGHYWEPDRLSALPVEGEDDARSFGSGDGGAHPSLPPPTLEQQAADALAAGDQLAAIRFKNRMLFEASDNGGRPPAA